MLASFLLLLLGLGECPVGPLPTPMRGPSSLCASCASPLAHQASLHPEEEAGYHHPTPILQVKKLRPWEEQAQPPGHTARKLHIIEGEFGSVL